MLANLTIAGGVYGRIGLVSTSEKAMLAERIETLRSLGPRHTQVGHEMFTAHDGDLYPMDFLAAAVLNRSMRLIKGFSDLIPSNFMSAAPLVRLQLDNLLRFHAAFLVKDPHGFVMEVLRGKQINKLTSHDGPTLSDAYLVRKVVAEIPEVKAFYEKGCAYIHLSELHLLHILSSSGDRKIEVNIGEDEAEVSDDLRLDAVETMIFVTQHILNHVRGWICTKANPVLVQEPLKRVRSLMEEGKKHEARSWLETVIRDHPDPVVVVEAKELLAALP